VFFSEKIINIPVKILKKPTIIKIKKLMFIYVIIKLEVNFKIKKKTINFAKIDKKATLIIALLRYTLGAQI
jgi:hypothetical protein